MMNKKQSSMKEEHKILNLDDFIGIVKKLKDSFSGSSDITKEDLDKIRNDLNIMKESIEKSMDNKDNSKNK